MVSIIIPVFNAEKYIYNCVNSIEHQCYKDIEIIIVNDGSTDKSKFICENLCKEYKNIRLVNLINGGVSKARNIGLKYALGKYIQFVDADDIVDYKYTETMLNEFINNDVDLVVSAYTEITNGINIIIGYKTTDFFYKDSTFLELIKTNRLLNSPCNKLYKKELIRSEFLENLSLGEDLIFNLAYTKCCNRMRFINVPLYNYIIHTESLTTKFSMQKYKNLIYLDQICCFKYGLQEIYIYNLVDNLYDLFCIWAKLPDVEKQTNNYIDLLYHSSYLQKRLAANIDQRNLKKKIFVGAIRLKAKKFLILIAKLISVKK